MERIKSEADYNMFDWWKKVFIKNYANFEGRARRSEYWYYVLCNFVISISVWILAIVFVFFGGFLLIPLLWLFGVASIIPNIAVGVRRLHDIGKSGAYYLFVLIPLVGPILLLVFFATEGDRGENQYGPDPKQFTDNEINQIGRSY
jgi:uncharacterized membrane protein YhaH (DUF805 family)